MTRDLVALLSEAGLDGRGGAGFDTATKIAAARRGRAGLLIVNGCDGELGSAKDTAVLLQRLDEVRHAAGLIDLARVRYAVHRGSVAEARLTTMGLDVLSVPHRYVSSEASALASLAAGGDARPLTKRRHLTDGGRTPTGATVPATLVLNAETMLRISEISQHGAAWFRSFGTAAEPGPRLVSISGAVPRAGVFETEAGLSLRDILDLAGGAAGHVHCGGLAGGWVRAESVAGAVWSRSGLAPLGAAPGSGTLAVLDPRSCPLGHVAGLLEYAAGESAGQCGPCMYGLPAVADDFRRVVAGDPEPWQRLHARLAALPGRGACHFPDGVAGLLRSTLAGFPDEVEAHLRRGCGFAAQPGSRAAAAGAEPDGAPLATVGAPRGARG